MDISSEINKDVKDHENNVTEIFEDSEDKIQTKEKDADNLIEEQPSPNKDIQHTPVLSIAHTLQQKYIYLNGNLDKEKHPILLCAYNRSLGTLDQDDFKAAVDYFREISSILWDQCKFLVIVDRQYGKWNSVKSILQHLQLFDKEEIFKVVVLKPQGFLQRHFGNDTKQIKEISGHEVIFLENPTMLEEYVELSCLPDELGGYDNFDVNEWVEYTTAVERFQQTCNKIRARVKDFRISFGNRIPLSSVPEIEHQMKQQEQMVNDIQEDIRCASEIADTLTPIVDKPFSHTRKGPTTLERYNSAQLKAYNERLAKYSAEIDKLWEAQKKFQEQSKELCNFEQSFCQISVKLMQITGILEGRTDTGDSLSSANELMMELDDFEVKRKEPYNEMMKLKEKGLQMIAFFGAFAKESVVVRCNEIKQMLKEFETKLDTRKELLQVSLDLFTYLDQIDKWCQVGYELIGSQSVEDLNSEAGAKKCLEQIVNFLDNKSGGGLNPNKARRMKEMQEKLGNPVIDEKVAQAMKRIQEVGDMLEKREASLKKIACKPKRPVQRVEAIVINKDYDLQKEKSLSPKTPLTPMTPTGSVSKDSIEVVITDDIEKYKKTKSFSKALRLSFRRPLSSPAQLKLAEYEEDPEHRKKIRLVMAELYETELVYVKDLKEIIEGYFALFDQPSFNVPEEYRNQKDVIFGNIEEIYIFHSEIFLEDLKECREAPYLIGQMIVDKKEEFKLYAAYCKNKPKSELVRIQMHKTVCLQEIQKHLGHSLNLDSYLLKPVQRVTKYRLLLTEMLKYVSRHNPAYNDIMEALECMKRVLRHVNDVMHSSGLSGFPTNLDEQGKLILQDPFIVWEGKKNSLKQFTKLGAKQRQVFLFEKCLIFSKKEVENGHFRTYQYKRHVWTADMGVTETVRGDINKFEVWSKVVAITLQAENLEMKNIWLKEIRKILMSQFEGARVETLSKEQIKNKLKFLDKTLRGSTPTLHISPSSEDRRLNPYNGIQKKNTLRACTSEINLLSEDNRSTDSPWSDSEFEDDDDTMSNQEQPIILIDTELMTEETTVDQEEDTVSPRTQEAIKFCAVADYTAVEETELTFKQEDLIMLIKEGDGGWWYCRNMVNNQEGWAPSGYLEINALDVTEGASEYKLTEPVKPNVPSPKKRLETAV